MIITFDLHPKKEVYRLLNDIAFLIRGDKEYLYDTFILCEMFLRETLEYSKKCRGRTFNFKENEYIEKMIIELEKIKNDENRTKSK